jgi:hypothetical protein
VETISRTVRFKSNEVRLIDEFLEKNPVFDFSTLTRIALLEFIKNPSLEIYPVAKKDKRGEPSAKTR